MRTVEVTEQYHLGGMRTVEVTEQYHPPAKTAVAVEQHTDDGDERRAFEYHASDDVVFGRRTPR
jgi:hypothetical protein